MERLTFDGNFCDIAMCRERPGGVFCKNGPCSQRKTWERLREIEDILGPDYDLDRLRALMKADRDGLVRIAKRPILERECCGNCGHFQRINGTARGSCAVREYIQNRWGQEDRKRGKFTPSQSRKACRQFQRLEERIEKERTKGAVERRDAGDRAAAAGGDGPAVRRPPGDGGSGEAGPVQGESEAST